MKFSPYAALLATGALMLATVVFAQTGSSVALLKAGAVSVDRDVSNFAAKALLPKETPLPRVASADPQQGVSER